MLKLLFLAPFLVHAQPDVNKAASQLNFAAKGAEVAAAEPSGVSVQALNPRYWVVIAASTKEERSAIANFGMAIAEIAKTTVSGIIRESELKKLEKKGFTVVSKMTLEEFSQKFFRDFPQEDAKYHNYKEMTDELRKIAQENPGLASLFSIGKSAEGREIWCLRFNTSPGRAADSKPGAVFMGEHHAREHLSVEIPLLYAKWLAENKEKPEVKNVIAERDIYILPMVNPDGGEYDIKDGSYKWWRKNRRKVSGGEYGVDLNRNYDCLWGQGGSSSSPGSETYMGPKAFSEPETQAVKKFFDERNNIKVFITYHTYGKDVMYPWGGSNELLPEKDLAAHKALARKMAEMTGYTSRQSSDMYIATGDTADWTYDKHKIFSFTIELEPDQYGSGGFYPGADMIDQSAKGNINAAYYLTKMAANPYGE